MKLLSLLMYFPVVLCYVSYQPEQIHLSYGDNPYEIVVTWNTHSDCDSFVEYGIKDLNASSSGTSELFVSGGSKQRRQYIHRVKLVNLTKESLYKYHCGSENGWSEVFWFKTPPAEDKWSPSVLIFGDLGMENPQSLPRLQDDTQNEMYDAAIHVGDFAYDMHSKNGHVGNEFFHQIQSVAAYIPYMTCPGNHEERYNFSDYRVRFSMPGGTEGLMYSFNMGPAHFISISTEFYYFIQYGLKLVVKQYEWLENDLKEATSPENRKQRPWIIVYGHRPMYCSNVGAADCNFYNTHTRLGIPFLHMFGLEELFYKYGVDLMFWAHEHSYERMWPLYNYTVYNGSFEQPYTNPKAPVHITTGSAGCKERITPFLPFPPAFSAFRSVDYGYTRLRILNATHLHVEQVSDDQDGKIIDDIWLIKHQHKPYSEL